MSGASATDPVAQGSQDHADEVTKLRGALDVDVRQLSQSLDAEMTKLRKALQPFAAMAQSYDDMTDTPEEIEFTILSREGRKTTVSVTREDFMQARAALAKGERT